MQGVNKNEENWKENAHSQSDNSSSLNAEVEARYRPTEHALQDELDIDQPSMHYKMNWVYLLPNIILKLYKEIIL